MREYLKSAKRVIIKRRQLIDTIGKSLQSIDPNKGGFMNSVAKMLKFGFYTFVPGSCYEIGSR